MKKSKSYFLTVACFAMCLFIIAVTACRKKDNELVINGPLAEPKLPAQPYVYQTGDPDIAALGRVLFYDKHLSLNNAISCGSCHKQEFAFADNHQFSIGLNNGYTSRNASAILSSSNHNKFWDGRADDYQTAVFMPVMNHLEMNIFDLNILPEKLSKLSYYSALATAAYGNSELSVEQIRIALALFVQNLYSINSKFDKHNLTALEVQGQNIFEGKARCYTCHSGTNFNSYSTRYENIGLDVEYSDKGRSKISHETEDEGKFMVPTLRNIALTAPYMHDGRYKSLREVIDHYDSGIQDSKNLSTNLRDYSAFNHLTEAQLLAMFDTNHDGEISGSEYPSAPPIKLNLTENEKKALEAFLRTLTDVSFTTDPKFSNPF